MTTKSFEIAVSEEFDDRGEPYEFHFSDAKDRPIRVYPPSESQVLLLMAIAGTDREEVDLRTVARAFSLLTSMLDDEGKRYVERRLENNTLNYTALFQIFDRIIELESGRPTEQSSDSSAPPSTTGKPSAGPARRAASTRSGAPARRSATTSTRSSSSRSGSTAKAASRST